MKALLQRVTYASVSIDGEIVGKIGQGLVALVGVESDDGLDDAKYLAEKTMGLRIFSDEDGKFNHSIQDISGEILVVSQFTLLANTRKGRRPSFTKAALPEKADAIIVQFIELLKAAGATVETGQFQAYMHVEIHNDGPVTIPLDSRTRFSSRRNHQT